MKKKLTLSAAALTLALGAGYFASSMPAYAQKAAATAEATDKVRAEIGKALNEAQALSKDKKFQEAVDKVHTLDAIKDKTPYELFAIDQILSIIAADSHDNVLLVSSIDNMIKSGRLPQEQVLRMTQGVAGIFYNDKKYPQAIDWLQRYLAIKADAPDIRALVARAYYLQDDLANCEKELLTLVKYDVDAGREPKEDNLRLLASAYQKQKDMDGYTHALELLVQYHPTSDYWADLVYRVTQKAGFSDHLRVDVYRLEYAIGNLNEAPRIVEMAQLLIQAGFPAEAKKVVDYGYDKGYLGKDKNADAHKHLRDQANKQATDDAKNLDAGETQAKAAKNGNGLVNIGYNYVVNSQFEKGIALLEQGIAKGGLKYPEEAKLHLGMAYLQSGNRAKATEVFQSLQTADGSADLGRLWLLVKPFDNKAQ